MKSLVSTAGRGRGSHHPLVERVIYHAARTRAWARRATRLGLALRAMVWLSGGAALLLAAPPGSRLGAGLAVAALAALLPAGYPGGRWPALLAVAAVGLTALRLAADPPADPLLLAAPVALLLYLHHSSAALAAQLRTDTVIAVVVLRHWAARTALVLGVSAPVGVAVVALPAPATWSATGLLALGVAAAVAVTALLLRLSHRP